MSELTFRNISASRAEILVYGEIGVNPFTGRGIDSADFVKSLSELGPVAEIVVRVNSPGGSVFHATAMYNALVRHPARILGEIDGVAGSAASFFVQAADDLAIAQNSKVMIHRAMGICDGNCLNMREYADILEGLDASIAGIYASRSGRRSETFLTMMNKDTWMTADQALNERLVDRVIPNKGAPVAIAPEFSHRFDAREVAALAAMVRDIVPRAPAPDLVKVTEADAIDGTGIAQPVGITDPPLTEPTAEDSAAIDVAAKLAEYNARVAEITG